MTIDPRAYSVGVVKGKTRAMRMTFSFATSAVVFTLTRGPIALVLALLGTVAMASSALAADYSVDYGVDTVNAGKDAGSLTCQFRQRCSAKLEPLGLNVSFDVSWKESGEAIIRLENDERSCCYFAGGRPSVTVDGRAPLSTLSFFKGAAPRGGLFIQNERAGLLYLRFNFH
jgi:hypothetical protein